MEKRTCKKCSIRFPLNSKYFEPHSGIKSGFRFSCRPCCDKQYKIQRVCLYCGKEFYVWPKAIKHEATKYCSPPCYKTDSRIRKFVECLYCGKPFEQVGSKERKYCCHGCFGKQHGINIQGENHHLYEKEQSNETREKRSRTISDLIILGLPRHNKYKHGMYESEIAGSVYLKSSYEFCFAEMLDAQNINWRYEHKRFEYEDKGGQHRNYVPDFYFPDNNIYVEVKGNWNKGLYKINEVMERHNIKIILLSAKTLDDFRVKATSYLKGL